jgi:hypothetical protein
LISRRDSAAIVSKRALPRTGNAREHRKPTLRDLDADVLEVVLSRALHADPFVTVGIVHVGQVSCCSANGASRFLIGPADSVATHGGITAISHGSTPRYVPGTFDQLG